MWSLALGLVTGPKKWLVIGIAAAVLVASVGGYIGWLKLHIAGLETHVVKLTDDLEKRTSERDLANEIARRNAQAITQMRATHERQLAALKTVSEQRERDLKRSAKVMEAIRAEPSGDDPIPPVLQRLLGDPDDGMPGTVSAGAGDPRRASRTP